MKTVSIHTSSLLIYALICSMLYCIIKVSQSMQRNDKVQMLMKCIVYLLVCMSFKRSEYNTNRIKKTKERHFILSHNKHMTTNDYIFKL